MKTMPRVASEMALHVLAYNLTRVMNILGVQPLLASYQGVVVIARALAAIQPQAKPFLHMG